MFTHNAVRIGGIISPRIILVWLGFLGFRQGKRRARKGVRRILGYAHSAFLLFVAASLTTAPAFCGGRGFLGSGCSTVGIPRVLWPFTFFRRLPLLSRKTIVIRRWDLLAFIVPPSRATSARAVA